MAHYLDPKNAFTFKHIFGKHEHLCISLLNSMLPLEKDRRTVSLEYQSHELTPEIPFLNDSIVDVCCTDSCGRRFTVKILMQWNGSFSSRVRLNASEASFRRLDTDKNYRFVQPVYALNFTDDIFDPDSSVCYHHYKTVNIENADKQVEGLELVFIELPKFRPANCAEKKLYDLWLMFLTEIKAGMEQAPPELLQEDVTREAAGYLERDYYTSAELDVYDKCQDIIFTLNTYYADAIEKGMELGLEKNRKLRMKEDRKLWIELSRMEIVTSSANAGLSIEQIQAVTGLDRERINEILDLNSVGNVSES
jgi:predicted transposase/invertase (TIGR01784 family)